MADLSQSLFLQSLGWATLNSLWQWAALWFLFLCVQTLFNLSSQKNYVLCLSLMAAGMLLFFYTFFDHYFSGASERTFVAHLYWAPSSPTWNGILSVASIIYLSLSVVPLYQFYKNCQYIHRLRYYGLQKAPLENRLFINKISVLLGITKKVEVYLSELVSSPITLGYLKPLILLPVASLNNLTTQQVEAVLLHELSHIKRYDYLVNMLVMVIGTVFYYNPFIKKFISAIDAYREECCDELVLQFEYDPFSYASALYLLEKNNTKMEILTMAAAKTKNLLARIKKILGVAEKTAFTMRHLSGLAASFLLIIVLNTLFIANKESGKSGPSTFSPLENSFYSFTNNEEKPKTKNTLHPKKIDLTTAFISPKSMATPTPNEPISIYNLPNDLNKNNSDIVNVAFDEVAASVSAKEKEHVEKTLTATKKVLSTLQWNEVEKSINDGMTSAEKSIAKNEYLEQLNNVNWKNLENNLKANYDEVNWNEVNYNLANALITIKLDSLQQSYSVLLRAIEKAAMPQSANIMQPMPDASMQDIIKRKMNIQEKLDSLKLIRAKKVVRL